MGSFASNLLSLFTPQFWRQQYADWRSLRFDRRHGVDTRTTVPVAALHDVEASVAAHAVHYAPTALPKFERAMQALDIDPAEFTFIDYGSGKGRVLMLAAALPFRRVVGIEVSARLNAIAAANIEHAARHDPRLARIELLCADARESKVPPGNLVAYFYNPFDGEVFGELRDRLLSSVRADPRVLVVVYVNPVQRALFDGVAGMRCLYDDAAVAVWRREA